ncbi:MAG: hypothetical protein AMS27_10240 [Bacteroides sp. SM23_62_1]|nr:MAG: hypothetical protein AMS27_10240 [Bacteroides sp. SM23_62_1]
MEKRKLNSEIVKRLRSDKQNLVLTTIYQLRNKVWSAIYIPEIIDIACKTKDDEVRRELFLFLSDMKDASGIPYIIEALKDRQYRSIWNEIISACWQSGLNFSGYLDTFIQIFLKEDYLTSLEAFSVIEQSIHYLEDSRIEHYRNILMSALEEIKDEKKPLASELINIMHI